MMAMTRGLGERQRKDRLLTTSKIASYLAVRPFTYQELQKESKIQRKRLRDGLDELITHKTVIKHRFSISNDPNLEHNSIYYLLNWSKTESKQLVNHYYNNSNSSANNKDTILTNKDGKSVHNRTDQPSIIDQLNVIAKKLESTTSHKEFRQLLSLVSLIRRNAEMYAVKEGMYLYDEEIPGVDWALKLVNFFLLNKAYSFLDTLIKSSADEKIEGLGIYRYSTLWEIMEKTGLLDKYKNEIH